MKSYTLSGMMMEEPHAQNPIMHQYFIGGGRFYVFFPQKQRGRLLQGKNHLWDASFACEVAHIRDETVERLVNFSQDHNLRRRGRLMTLRNGPKLMGFSVYKKSHLGAVEKGYLSISVLRMLRDFVWWKLGRPENCH